MNNIQTDTPETIAFWLIEQGELSSDGYSWVLTDLRDYNKTLAKGTELIQAYVNKAVVVELDKIMTNAGWLSNNPYNSMRNHIDDRISELKEKSHHE